MKLINYVLQDLKNGENVENYAIILASVSALFVDVIILPILGRGDITWLSDVTLGVLTLLAYGRILDKKRLDRIEQKISSAIEPPLLQEYPDTLIEDMRETSELWLVGITLSRTINTHYSLFKRKLQNGDKIRVLLVSPDSPASELSAKRDRRGKDRREYDAEIKSTAADFCRLASSTNGDIELRTIAAVLSFGFYAIHPRSSDGKLYVEHYAYRSEYRDIPKMVLRDSDGYLYDAFQKQLFNLWDDSVVWDCTLHSSQNDADAS